MNVKTHSLPHLVSFRFVLTQVAQKLHLVFFFIFPLTKCVSQQQESCMWRRLAVNDLACQDQRGSKRHRINQVCLQAFVKQRHK